MVVPAERETMNQVLTPVLFSFVVNGVTTNRPADGRIHRIFDKWSHHISGTYPIDISGTHPIDFDGFEREPIPCLGWTCSKKLADNKIWIDLKQS